MIRVLVIEADGRWEFKEISNTLASVQQCVGGYIEVVGYARVSPIYNATVIVNENGKIEDLPINDVATKVVGLMHLLTGDDTINSPMLIAMSKGEELVSMNKVVENTLRGILA